MTNEIILALGTNLGRRWSNMEQALAALGELITISVLSPVYETAPWGPVEQPDYLNLCLLGQTNLPPRSLLERCKEVENRLGREPGQRWGPRLIDIDIIYYENLILDEEGLTIPHARLAERAFVLAPLADIVPEWIDPHSGLTVRQMLEAVDLEAVTRLERELQAVTGQVEK